MCHLTLFFVLTVSGDGITLVYQPSKLETTFSKVRPQINNTLGLFVCNLQIDNQMCGRGNFDFPVILKRQKEASEVHQGLGNTANKVTESELKSLKENSVIATEFVLSCDLVSSRVVMETMDLAVQPLIVYIEDTFIYEFLHKLDR